MSFSIHSPLLPPTRFLSTRRHGTGRMAGAVRDSQSQEASAPRHRPGAGPLQGPSPSPSWEELLGRR